jgi:hypothetical protein
MKWIISLAGACCLAGLLASGIRAQTPPATADAEPIVPVAGPRCCVPQQLPDCCRPPTAPGSATPYDPSNPNASNIPPNAGADAFARAPEAGTQPAASADPALFGDLGGGGIPRIGAVLPTPGNGATTTGSSVKPGGPLSANTPNIPYGRAIAGPGDSIAAIAPLGSRANFKITEDDSPAPVDRVYFIYNYYNDVGASTGLSPSRLDLQREALGLEKTFLDGNASVGLRLPYLELTGNSEFDDWHIGDLSLLFKYAFINNKQTGNVVSAGMVLTVPTGEGLQIEGESSLNSVVFQPFVGGIYNYNAFFFQGFSSIAVPDDMRDITLWFNSMAAGYHLLPKSTDPDDILRDVAPVVELHINTPLNHRGSESVPIGFPDTVDLTGGFHFVFRRATIGIAVGTPLTGPKPFEFEGLANVDFHF